MRRATASLLETLRAPADVPWKQGVRTAFRRYLYIAVPVVLWALLCVFELMSANLIAGTRLIISAVLFILAMPLSVLIRLDTISIRLALSGGELGIVFLGLFAVGINYLAIGLFVGWLRGLRAGKPKVEKKEKRDSQR